MRLKQFLPLLAMFWITFGFGQEIWDLERCIRYANENSITLKQADINIENVKLTQQQNKMAQLPNLNGSGSYAFLFGRSIDPTTNEFKSQNIQSNNLGLSAGAILYSGLQIRNSIKQSQLDVSASEADKFAAANDLGLAVASAYLGILQAEDQISVMQNRKKQTEDQLSRTNKLIAAGTLPEANRYDIEAQLASDEQGLTAANNGVILAYQALKQLLNLDPIFEMEIVRPEVILPVDGNLEAYAIEEVFSTALTTQPQINANELRIKSAETAVKVAKGSLHPTVSIFGGVNTNYSSVAPDLDNPIITNERTEEITQAVDIPGFPAINEVTFLNPTADVDFPTRPYTQQLSDNVSENIGVSVSIPIFNNNRNKIAVQRAKLNVKSAQYSDELERNQLKADIQRALTDARAAYDQLEASEKTVAAREKAFENAEKRYTLGAINTFEYNLAKDNLDIARSNSIFAKYDYVFKMKVLDYYQGKPIKLD